MRLGGYARPGLIGERAVVNRFVVFVSAVVISALTTAANAGYFPSRPPGVQLQHFTGVIGDYGFGEGTGGFYLIVGATKMDFYIGLPMKINGHIVRCQSPDPVSVQAGLCTDWPPQIVEGESVVTATCWSDLDFDPGTPTLFCDQIDSASPGP
jgi:hypothetical protein